MSELLGDRLRLKKIWTDFTTIDPSNIKVEERTSDISKKNIDPKTGKVSWEKAKLSLYYLQWASCWSEVMKLYPESTYSFKEFEHDGKMYDCRYYPNGSATVVCEVTIDGITREMWLPVMDFNNKAIVNPDARQISDAKMRCLVKNCAMFGLGINIYDGSYSPTENLVITETKENTNTETEKKDGMANQNQGLHQQGQTVDKLRQVDNNSTRQG